MPQYSVVSLVDITRTNPARSELDSRVLSQQANFNSLVQAIGLRSNVEWTQDPVKHVGALPDPFDGRGTYWSWTFSAEREDVFSNSQGTTGLLTADLHNVPVITGLDETVDVDPAVFLTQGAQMNIWVFLPRCNTSVT